MIQDVNVSTVRDDREKQGVMRLSHSCMNRRTHPGEVETLNHSPIFFKYGPFAIGGTETFPVVEEWLLKLTLRLTTCLVWSWDHNSKLYTQHII